MRTSIVTFLPLLCHACGNAPVAGVRVDVLAQDQVTVCLPGWPSVDVLIVVDGSPSMAQEAETMATEALGFGLVYDRSSGAMNYRIAVVDSQVAQPGCDVESDHAGRFVDTSCRERLGAFVTDASIEGEASDVRGPACTDWCAAPTLQMLPSAVIGDPRLRARPWVEASYRVGNLPEGRTLADDLTCRVPAGVAGCTYEAPLEAMRRALMRTQDPDDPAFGFLRDDAALFVLFITDEPDCSFGPDHAAIDALLDPNGPGTYWSDPQGPTSGTCWNAGVACSDEDGVRQCHSVDRPVGEGSTSVLRPVADYVQILRDIETYKQHVVPDAGRRVFVSTVGGFGVPGERTFADAVDPVWQAQFGVGPGCATNIGQATPPVRLAELTAALAEADGPQENEMWPVCGRGWNLALACVPGQPPPNPCIEAPFADADSTTEALEISSTVQWEGLHGERDVLPPCTMLDDQWVLPTDHVGCVRVDPSRAEARCNGNGVPWDVMFADDAPRGCFTFTYAVEPQPPPRGR